MDRETYFHELEYDIKTTIQTATNALLGSQDDGTAVETISMALVRWDRLDKRLKDSQETGSDNIVLGVGGASRKIV